MKRFALVVPVLSIGLVLSACDEKTTPAEPAPASARPSFDLEDIGGGATTTAGYEVQEVNVTHGSDFNCVGVFTGTFDNVVAPPGAFCYLFNATVRGNVKALQDAVLTLDLNTTVGGSVQGDKADVLQVRNNITIQGSIEMVEGGPHPSFREVAICGTHLPNGSIKIIKMTGGLSPFNGIDVSPTAFCALPSPNNVQKGNVQVEDNTIPAPAFLSITNNTVAQNLQVYKTRGSGVKTVMGNVVGESVQCFDNQPPFVGGPNTAPKKEGQCF
jgi:hypothetical protein